MPCVALDPVSHGRHDPRGTTHEPSHWRWQFHASRALRGRGMLSFIVLHGVNHGA